MLVNRVIYIIREGGEGKTNQSGVVNENSFQERRDDRIQSRQARWWTGKTWVCMVVDVEVQERPCGLDGTEALLH